MSSPFPVDPRFRVEVITRTPDPQRAVWAGMHQDYSERFVFDEPLPTETEAGAIAVKRLLAGERGHYGPLEHPQITFNAGWFPHSVMQQARTHRISVSFDVQSMRYTGSRICRAAQGAIPLEEVFYLRPLGDYADRKGRQYRYTAEQRSIDLGLCQKAAERYAELIEAGMAEEQARSILPFDYRQHFVVSFSLRALLHFLDLRSKRDAQGEITVLCDLMWPHVESWVPEIAAWYRQNRLHRARLAP